MRTLTPTLLAAQKKPDRLPYVEAKVYDFEQGIQRLHWTRLYTGTEPDNHHGIAFDGQGSMHRIRSDGSNLYRQKITSPGPTSDYSQWTLIATDCSGPCAIAASGAKVYIFYRTTGNTIWKLYSHNYGVDWTNAQLSTYANVLSLASAWWGTSNIVVCFAAISWQLNAIVLNTDTQAASEYPHHEAANHPLLNTYGIGVTYEPDHIAIIFAGKQEASPYNFHALYRSQLSNTYTWLGWEYFITSPEGEGISYEYPDCHIPSSPQDYEQLHITSVEKFSGAAPYTLPLACHPVRGSLFSEMAYSEPKPFLDIPSVYGLRITSTATHWWLERPDGVWRAPRAAEEPLDLTPNILSLQSVIASEAKQSLSITLNNHKAQYATPPEKRSEVVLKLGYKTSAGNEAVEVGRYWIDRWEYSSTPGTSLFTLYCLDGSGLSDKWSARYQMRWNQSNVSPKTVWELFAALLSRWGIYLYNKGTPRSNPILYLYPDFVLQPGTDGNAAIRRLLSFVPDALIYEGYQAYTKDPRPDESSCYQYKNQPGYHAILAGEYGQAVPVSRVRAVGRDAQDNKLLCSAYDWQLLGLGIDDFRTDYDPNLDNTTRAQERADAILRRNALAAQGGQITVPVNCGQELYDVITATDERCGISNKLYRVMAIQSDYSRREARYSQKLILAAP